VEAAEVPAGKIGILPINSSLFCQDDNDHAKLWIGRRCLDSAIRELQQLRRGKAGTGLGGGSGPVGSVKRPSCAAEFMRYGSQSRLRSTSAGCKAGLPVPSRIWCRQLVPGATMIVSGPLPRIAGKSTSSPICIANS
jgi:hypothetical protein